MIIICPHCQTRYEVAARAIGDRGRTVQCANCGQSWLADKNSAVQEPVPVAVPAREPASAAVKEDALDVEFEEVEAPHSAAGDPDRSRARQLAQRHRDIAKALPAAKLRRYLGGGAAVAAGVVFLALFSARTTIVRQVPDLASFYAALGMQVNVVGLDFSDVRTVRGSQHGNEVLIVEGRISNVAGRMMPVPPVRVSLTGDDGNGVYEWRTMAEASALDAGETIRFETQLMSPPANVARVTLKFDPGSATVPTNAL